MPLDHWRSRCPDKFAKIDEIFGHIRRGNTIFIGSACAEPQHLVQCLISYIESKPKAFVDAEVIHVRTLGVAPYTQEKYKYNFRHNSFFIGESTRSAVNTGLADYTPIFLFQVPRLISEGLVKIDIALIQTSPPDIHGYMSLGVSVDIVMSAVKHASLVITQINSHMPRVHGDTFIHMDDVDFAVAYDEELLEYTPKSDSELAQSIGKNVARLIEDGDTIQVGYGSIPNAILCNLSSKKYLGIHTELISDGIVDLMKKGVIDNSRKNINKGKTVATFCMGRRNTYQYIHDNPSIEFHPIDYTNNPIIISQHHHMVAINSALEIDLTGQATAESIGKTSHSGVGGQADFMRGIPLSKGGKTIMTLKSTARKETISRIVPFLGEGASTTLIRGDIHYVVTEYGIAYLHGKSIRERAMDLIAIAHPKFRPWLVSEAKKAGLIYKDQAFIPGEKGIYPAELETHRTTKSGLEIHFRPIKISDEDLLKDFIYSLSDKSLNRRFMSARVDIPHERRQEFVVIDYSREVAILAVIGEPGKEVIVGVGRFYIDPDTHTAEVAFTVGDDYQDKGIGTELLAYLTYLAKRQGLIGFTAEVFSDNLPMLHVFEKGGFDLEKRTIAGVSELKMTFRDKA